jgi:two-component system CheB/CheR fusion protein
MQDGALHLVPRPDDRSQHMPIDSFFRSLAEFAQSRAMAVVLSGSGSDGATGIREVKAAGGITFAQDPRTAKFDSMPRAAITTGAVDLILPPAQIAEELLRITGQPLTAEQFAVIDREEAGHPTEAQLARIFAMLRSSSGVDFAHYKFPTIRRRLHRRMVLRKVETIDEYLHLLQRNPQEVHSLYQDILIHVTRFFRDPDTFDTLIKTVFPRLMEHRQPKTPIRIWVPGCSTGEEAYSVAFALLEFLGDDLANTPVQIFATDVSETAVDRARAGLYPENISADVSTERLRRFFVQTDGHYRINKQVRDLCVFARQDLTRDPPFSKLDLIVCRNVFIYLGPVLQRRLMGVFHYALKASGFLMLGSAETIGPYSNYFTFVDKRHRIYAKNAATTRADMDFVASSSRGIPVTKPAIEPRALPTVQNEVNRIILSRFAPSGVLVDSDMKIIQFRGQAGAYFEPAPGEASLDLFKMAREGLLYGLRTAISDARKRDKPIRKEGLHVRQGSSVRNVNLEVIPVAIPGEGRYYLVLFEPVGEVRKESPSKAKTRGKTSRTRSPDRERVLEQELAASREYLQAMIQDLEAANEELQSANEEVLSANEELQSTNEELDTAKEELQSTNEELNTVNEELQGRNDELSRVNSDLMNLVGSVQIAIVIVQNDLRIRRFTPMAEKVLNLIPSDVGRPIGDIKPTIDCPDLEAAVVESIETVTIKERECRDRNGNPYLLRIRPYKDIDNRIDGAVLALFDISESTRRHDASMKVATDATERAELLREEAAEVLDTLPQPIIVLDEALRVQSINQAFARTFGLLAEEAHGRRIYELSDGVWAGAALHELLEDRLRREESIRDFEIELPTPGFGSEKMIVNAWRLNRPEHPPLIVLAIDRRSNGS